MAFPVVLYWVTVFKAPSDDAMSWPPVITKLLSVEIPQADLNYYYML